MAITRNITATYRGPGRVVARILGGPRREDQVLYFLMAACVVIFIAQTPYQAREAHLDESVPFQARLYWSAFLWIFLFPLVMYALAGLVWLLARVIPQAPSGYEIRVALFWALLASTPIVLLLGLTAGMIGPGPALQGVALLWCAVFLWFWVAGTLATRNTERVQS
ncbi:YIP1 family protein [uncultured Tateyamaria sp.]|uniref:YIP1 family protein n=1 Tax=uncultured Tateyamaria sp. TaxID=455651 RepID=UPI002637A178|nr:YIP1 family protein [uncultured Tateyamaria sp.]